MVIFYHGVLQFYVYVYVCIYKYNKKFGNPTNSIQIIYY